MTKNGGRKSRDTLPLKLRYSPLLPLACRGFFEPFTLTDNPWLTVGLPAGQLSAGAGQP